MNPVDCTGDFRVGDLAHLAHARREVVRAEHDAVEPVDLHDRLDAVDRVDVFRLYQHGHRVVGDLHVLGEAHAVAVRAAKPDPTTALRRVACVADDVPCLLH